MKSPTLLLLALVLAFSMSLHAAVISSAVRLDSTGVNPTFSLTQSATTFAPHSQVYYDYSFYYRNVPGYLLGADELRTRLSDSQDADYQLRLTLAVPATLFLIIDDRIEDIAGTMPWLATMGFTDTGDNADYIFSSSFVRTLSIYKADFAAGDVVLPAQNSPLVGTTISAMYTVGAKAIVTSVPEPGTSSYYFMAILMVASAGFQKIRKSLTTRGNKS